MNDYNLIINIGGENYQNDALERRVKIKGSEKIETRVLNLQSKGINHEPTEQEIEAFQKLTSNSRIYILDHGSPNSPFLGKNHYTELAEFFGKRISNELKENGKKLKISILGCHSALGGYRANKSFSALFHRTLKNTWKINSIVKARKEVTIVDCFVPQEGKRTSSLLAYGLILTSGELGLSAKKFKEFLATNKKPNIKTTFKFDKKDNQISVDSYVEKFYKKTKQIINKIGENAQIEEAHGHEIKKIMLNIRFILKSKKSTHLNTVHLICKNLFLLKKTLQSLNDNSQNKIIEEIDALIKFSQKSINKHSENYTVIRKSEEKNAFEGEPIQSVKFKRMIGEPIRNELLKLPKTQFERPLKDFATKSQAMLDIGRLFSWKARAGRDLNLEIDFVNIFKLTIKIVNSNKSFDEKKELIQKLSEKTSKKFPLKTSDELNDEIIINSLKKTGELILNEPFSGLKSSKYIFMNEIKLLNFEKNSYQKAQKLLFSLALKYIEDLNNIKIPDKKEMSIMKKNVLQDISKQIDQTQKIIKKYQNEDDLSITEIGLVMFFNKKAINKSIEKLNELKTMLNNSLSSKIKDPSIQKALDKIKKSIDNLVFKNDECAKILHKLFKQGKKFDI